MPLKLTRRHGSPYWYIRGSVRGVRVDESTGISDRKKADEQRVRREAEIQDRTVHGNAVSRTFAEAALSYMQGGGEPLPEKVLLHFGRMPVGGVGQAELEEAARKLYPGRALSTINRALYTPVVAVLNQAARLKWCSRPVIARPKQPPGRIRYVSYEEAERLIESAAPHLKPLVIFLFCTGCRLGEALYLDWAQVDLSRAHVSFLKTKNAETRGVPLHGLAVAALANLKHRKGAVFRRPDGKPYMTGKFKRGNQIRTAWLTMCRRAKISNFTPHDCRHTWATWHYRVNRDLITLMQLGGWKSERMVMRYAHVNVEHLAPTIDRLWGNHGERPMAPFLNPLNHKAN